MKSKRYLLLVLLLVGTNLTFAQTKHEVPADFETIQQAIDEADSGDTILVAPGTYFENIIFNGKDIYLTSEFTYTLDCTSIENTIIDGSQPFHPDTGSVVRIVNGESDAAVLRGFTITGGTGTKTWNEIEQLYFRTGGGISVDQSSPTLINNIIRNNESMNTEGVAGAGGGGIRIGLGVPYIANNKILHNSGRYAGGIMIAFCEGMTFENNIVAYNYSTGDFGGGAGMYVDWEDVNIINNTIVHNHSDGTGGGLCITGNSSTIKNCIIYGNSGSSSESIRLRFGGSPEVSYSNVSGQWFGIENSDTLPMFVDTIDFHLLDNSPCIDAGDPTADYTDQAAPEDLATALAPAKGSSRNDQGAYGGQSYQLKPVETEPEPTGSLFLGMDHIELNEHEGLVNVKLSKSEYLCISVLDSSGRLLEVLHMGKLEQGLHHFRLGQQGLQLISVQNAEGNRLTRLVY